MHDTLARQSYNSTTRTWRRVASIDCANERPPSGEGSGRRRAASCVTSPWTLFLRYDIIMVVAAAAHAVVSTLPRPSRESHTRAEEVLFLFVYFSVSHLLSRRHWVYYHNIAIAARHYYYYSCTTVAATNTTTTTIISRCIRLPTFNVTVIIQYRSAPLTCGGDKTNADGDGCKFWYADKSVTCSLN